MTKYKDTKDLEVAEQEYEDPNADYCASCGDVMQKCPHCKYYICTNCGCWVVKPKKRRRRK